MEIVDYLSQEYMSVISNQCVHLRKDSKVQIDKNATNVWLESFDREWLLRVAKMLNKPVLNSLWLDINLIESYKEHLHLFSKVVLVPYRPDAEVQDYWRNLNELLAIMGNCDVEFIIDICILPKVTGYDEREYLKRLNTISGFETCGAIDNYSHTLEPSVCVDLYKKLEHGGLTYGIMAKKVRETIGNSLGGFNIG